jgi:ABC-type multidrug transport system ATPase subunit
LASGTGIGQVIAILYVVVASDEPRTIIIDEPNSFLHPGAAKKLMLILRKFPQHQYFISTHSPEILRAAKPATITRLKFIEGETVVESVDLSQTQDLRETLLEIGIKFSDVFFAENILWVEGPTEAEAFPLILEKEKDTYDVTFLPLVSTGDLREKKQARKNAKLAFEIYRRLSAAHALAPPFSAVILDKEGENSQEIKELKKISQGKAKFISRKMFENYLLDSEAIAEVFNSECDVTEKKISVEKVENWINDKRENKIFLPAELKEKDKIKDKEWLENVDATKLLESLFLHFSAKTIEYRKTTHSVRLTQWLLENKPGHLSELRDFLIGLVASEKSA